jgi:L-ascorbate metabolism protein UlaG (beta-lactamase superfamily)
MRSTLIIFTLLAGLLWAVYALGWLTTPASWRDTTGWKRVPERQRPPPAPADEFELRWLGHAGLLVRWQGVTLLIDPNTAPRCTVSRRVMLPPPDLALAGPVSAVLISHAHYDHLDLDTLMRVPSIGFTAVPEGAEVYFDEAQAAHAHPRTVRRHEPFRVGALEIIPVPAAHNGNRFHPLRSRKAAVGYLIRSPTRSLYVAGDTARHNAFEEIRDRYHPDVAVLPIGSYRPRLPLKYHHLNPEEAADVAVLMDVEYMVPYHFGTFRLSLDPPASALPRFAAAAVKRGLVWYMPEFAGSPEDLRP